VKRTHNYHQYIKMPFQRHRSLYLKNNFYFQVIKHQKSTCKQNSEGSSAWKTAGPITISWSKQYEKRQAKIPT